MIKFIQPMAYTIGGKTAAYSGRDPFPTDDPEFKKALLATGVFTEQESGDLFYSGDVTVDMADGSTVQVDVRGFIAVDKADLENPNTTAFR